MEFIATFKFLNRRRIDNLTILFFTRVSCLLKYTVNSDFCFSDKTSGFSFTPYALNVQLLRRSRPAGEVSTNYLRATKWLTLCFVFLSNSSQREIRMHLNYGMI